MAGIVTLDSATRRALIAFLDEESMNREKAMEKVWLSKKQLLQQFGMFTDDWINTHGHLLPRKRISIVDLETGKKRATGWAYDRNAIQRLLFSDEPTIIVENGKIRIQR